MLTLLYLHLKKLYWDNDESFSRTALFIFVSISVANSSGEYAPSSIVIVNISWVEEYGWRLKLNLVFWYSLLKTYWLLGIEIASNLIDWTFFKTSGNLISKWFEFGHFFTSLSYEWNEISLRSKKNVCSLGIKGWF